MTDRIVLISEVQKRGSVFLRFDGKTGDVRIVSRNGHSLRMEANKTYEIDCRNPILASYSLKQQCLVLEKPKAAVAEQIGKKVSGTNLKNTFTSLKIKAVPIEDMPIDEAGDMP